MDEKHTHSPHELFCDTCHRDDVCVRAVPAFMNLSDEEIRDIADLVEHREFKNQDVLFHEGEPTDRLIILRRGKIKLLRYGTGGEEIVVDFLLPGDIHGGEDLFSDRRHKETGLAIGQAGICLISYDKIKELIMKKPLIGIKIMEYLSTRLNQSHAMLEIISTKDTLKKIIMFLLERSQRTGSMTLELTQSDIGNSIYLTKETVNRKLSDLKESGLIEKKHGRIILKDFEGLTKLLES